eukprot:8352151-Ditylum_brightwellii.AAC.1
MEKFAPLHRLAPAFTKQGKTQEILVTGIKVVDLLPLYQGRKDWSLWWSQSLWTDDQAPRCP